MKQYIAKYNVVVFYKGEERYWSTLISKGDIVNADYIYKRQYCHSIAFDIIGNRLYVITTNILMNIVNDDILELLEE